MDFVVDEPIGDGDVVVDESVASATDGTTANGAATAAAATLIAAARRDSNVFG